MNGAPPLRSFISSHRQSSPRSQLDALPPKRIGDRRVRGAVACTAPRERVACCVELGGFADMLVDELLAADCDVLLAEDAGDASLGDNVRVLEQPTG